ncbi:MAG TPA: DUF6600 domain-containing protein [Pyrinomonadaceae bacterium]|nr:DUF6600 domain-containing protein [Pyrinomonadaceae bacterium]
MNNIKVWPHMTIVAVVVALLAGLGVAWYMNNERTASAEELPYAARIQRVDGEVALTDAVANAEGAQWIPATLNQPLSVGDRIYTRDNARTSLAFTGRNYARLNPNTALDVVALDDDRTQLALREGSAIFDVGYPGDLFEVGTPYGAVHFDEPGLYNVGYDNDGNVLVSVLSGVAQIAGLAGTGQIDKGEILTLAGTTAAQVLLSRMNGGDAGYLVDDYYRYQYPNAYDGRYSNYDVYLNDPYYYDPYRRYQSYQYVSSVIPGVNDLDYYGDWQSIDNYGYAWRPRVDSGWAPYQQGYWTNDYPYGATWVSNEPWGYAPYHYGRWANVGNQWYWVPDGVNSTPAYSPSLVAFVPMDGGQIGWVPLAPGETYVPRYYDENWQPHYLTRGDVYPGQLVNLAIPGAVTVVPIDAFGRVIDGRSIRRFDPQTFASVRPTLEPLLLTPLRNAVINSAWGRGKIDLPPGIAKKLDDRSVYVGDVPRYKFRNEMAKRLRVEAIPEKARKEKFQVKDNRGGPPVVSSRPDDVARKQEIDRLSREAAKGNRDAERQARQLEQEQRKAQADQERAARKAAQQPQGERVGNPVSRPEKSQGRQDVPKAREPQRRQQVAPQPQPVGTARGRQDVPKAREPQRRQQVVNQPQPVQSQPKAQKPAKAERQAAPSSGGQGQGGGGGKSKGKGKP